MKKILAMMAMLVGCGAFAVTKTWVGGASGSWHTDGNWDPTGVPVADDDVEISGAVEVTFSSGDWSPNGYVWIREGAKLTQTHGGWQNFGSEGHLYIDGGTYNAGSSTNFRLNGGKITITGEGVFVGDCELSRGEASVLAVNSGTMTIRNFRLTSSDTLGRGAINSVGELTLSSSIVLDGFSISCTTIVPLNNPTITLKKGTLTTTRLADNTTPAGTWGDCTYNFVPGKQASFSALATSTGGAYADTFGGAKFKYNGSGLTADEFAETFDVVEVEEGDRTRYTISSHEVAGLPEIEGIVTTRAEVGVTVAVTMGESSPSDTVVTLFYDSSDHEHNTEFGWPNSITLEAAEGESVFSGTVTVPDGKYYYLVRAKAAMSDPVWSPGTLIAADMPTDSNVWLGKNADVQNPSNWSKGAVPGEDDIVEFNQYFSEATVLQWDLTAINRVAGWRQTAPVTVYIRSSQEQPLVITGSVDLAAGTWTHAGPSETPTEAVNVSVGGSMTIGSNARIIAGTAQNANGDDGCPRGYKRGTGPGFLAPEYGSAHAGDGGVNPRAEGTDEPVFVSYGSILNPDSYGSGGYGDGDSYAGGGFIRLTVGGTLTVNGLVCSRGFGYPLTNSYKGGAGAGGSVNLTAGALAGAGTIDANGGNNGYRGPGSGGRVKIALTGAGATFEAFTGSVNAYGGCIESLDNVKLQDTSPAAAGTVALTTVAGTKVIVDNLFRDNTGAAIEWYSQTNATPFVAGTHLPAKGMTNEEKAGLRATVWELKNHGTIRLTQDVRVDSLVLASADGDNKILTDGYNLTVRHLTVGGESKHGTFTAADLPGVVVGTGSVKVNVGGMILYVR